MNGPEVQPILDSAERAASSGDYGLAESLLREVARLQAEILGPQHPDLASTFNNLGVVCERAHKLVDAGQFYLQALSIASASLNAQDPLVVTSRENCNQFHRALGLVEERAYDREIVTTIPSSGSPRQAIVAGIAIGVALLAALGIWLTRAPAEQPTAADGRRAVEQRLSAFGDPLVPAAAARFIPPQGRHASRPPASETIAKRPAPAIEAAPARIAVPTPQKVDAQVLEASLCHGLSISAGRWECMPTPGLAAGDLLYFYTRIASSTGTRIHHRWYRNGTLRQDVGLVVHANPSAGYRTYSQRRVEPGDWRVAVVGADGEILREQRVEVPQE